MYHPGHEAHGREAISQKENAQRLVVGFLRLFGGVVAVDDRVGVIRRRLRGPAVAGDKKQYGECRQVTVECGGAHFPFPPVLLCE